MSEPLPSPLPSKQGVVAILQDDQQHYLVIQRGLTIKRAPGWWCFPGGEVEPGETLEAAIQREMQEELSLAIVADAKIHQSISPNGEYLLHWFRVKLSGPVEALRPHEIEVAQVRWLSAAEILQLPNVLPGLSSWLSGRTAPDKCDY